MDRAIDWAGATVAGLLLFGGGCETNDVSESIQGPSARNAAAPSDDITQVQDVDLSLIADAEPAVRVAFELPGPVTAGWVGLGANETSSNGPDQHVDILVPDEVLERATKSPASLRLMLSCVECEDPWSRLLDFCIDLGPQPAVLDRAQCTARLESAFPHLGQAAVAELPVWSSAAGTQLRQVVVEPVGLDLEGGGSESGGEG